MHKRLDTFILAGLTILTAALAGTMWFMKLAGWLEVVSFVTGAICVWLTVKESVWNFPVSLLNVTTYSIVYFQTWLFADASLQVIYFVLTAIGWYMWLYGGEKRTALRIVRTSIREATLTVAAVALITAGYWWLLVNVPNTVPLWDALTTGICLGAQWLLTRKRLENWVFWIIADVIYVPLYLYKGLYLTSLLYGVFLIMATMGLREWLDKYRKQRAPAAEPATAEAPA